LLTALTARDALLGSHFFSVAKKSNQKNAVNDPTFNPGEKK